MSAKTLAPNSAGDNTGLSVLYGAATHWQALLTQDGATSYVGTSVPAYDLYNLGNFDDTGLTNIVISNININGSFYSHVTDAFFKLGLKTNGSVYWDAAYRANTPIDAWHTYYTSYALNPNTGVAWTVEDLNAIQLGLYMTSIPQGRCSTVWLTVTYTADILGAGHVVIPVIYTTIIGAI